MTTAEIDSRILSLSGGETNSNPIDLTLINNLIKEWEKYKESSAKISEMTHIQLLMQTTTQFTYQLLGSLPTLPLQEFNYLDYQEHVLNAIDHSPSQLVMIVNIAIVSEVDDYMHLKFKLVDYEIKVSKSDENGKRVLTLYAIGYPLLTKELNLDACSYYIMVNLLTDDLKVTGMHETSSDENEIWSTDAYEISEETKGRNIFSIIEASLNLVDDNGDYKVPTLEVIFTTTDHTTSTKKKLDIDKFTFTFNADTTIWMVEPESYVLMDVENQSGPFLDYGIIKIMSHATKMQLGYYQYQQSEVRRSIGAGIPMINNSLDIIDEISRLSEAMERVTIFEPVEINKPDGRGILISNVFSQKLPKVERLRSMTTPQLNRSSIIQTHEVIQGGIQTRSIIFAPLESRFPKVAQLQTVEETERYYIVAEFSFEQESLRMLDSTHLDKPSPNGNHLVGWRTADMKVGELTYPNLVIPTQSIRVPIPAYDSTQRITLINVFMLFKDASENLTSVNARIGYHLSTSSSYALGGSPGIAATYNHPQYGELSGIKFPIDASATEVARYDGLEMEIPVPRTLTRHSVKFDPLPGLDRYGVMTHVVDSNAGLYTYIYKTKMESTLSGDLKIFDTAFEAIMDPDPDMYLEHLVADFYDGTKTFKLSYKLETVNIANEFTKRGITRGSASQVLTTAYLTYDFKVTAMMPIAPGERGLRIHIDPSISELEMWVMQLYNDIQDLKSRVISLESRVENMEKEMTAIYQQLNPGAWEQIVSFVIESAFSILLPGIGFIVGKALVGIVAAAARGLRNVGRIIYSYSSSISKVLRGMISNKNSSLDYSVVFMVNLVNDIAAKAANFNKKLIDKLQRPVFKQPTSKGYLIERFDPSESIDFNFHILTMGHSRDLTNYSPHIPNRNVQSTDLAFPEFTFITEPLTSIGNSTIRNFAHSASNNPLVRRLTALNGGTISTVMPYHARAVITYYYRGPEGVGLFKRKIIIGVADYGMEGEILSGVQRGPGIGGYIVDFKQVGIVNGTYVYEPRSWIDVGLTAEDVLRFYKTAGFKPREDTSTNKQWDALVNLANSHSQRHKELYTVNVPNYPRVKVIEDFVRRPPSMKYDLIFNNCQDVARDLDRFLRRGTQPRSFDARTSDRMMSDYYSESLTEVKRISSVLSGHSEAKFNADFKKNEKKIKSEIQYNMSLIRPYVRM